MHTDQKFIKLEKKIQSWNDNTSIEQENAINLTDDFKVKLMDFLSTNLPDMKNTVIISCTFSIGRIKLLKEK